MAMDPVTTKKAAAQLAVAKRSGEWSPYLKVFKIVPLILSTCHHQWRPTVEPVLEYASTSIIKLEHYQIFINSWHNLHDSNCVRDKNHQSASDVYEAQESRNLLHFFNAAIHVSSTVATLNENGYLSCVGCTKPRVFLMMVGFHLPTGDSEDHKLVSLTPDTNSRWECRLASTGQHFNVAMPDWIICFAICCTLRDNFFQSWAKFTNV